MKLESIRLWAVMVLCAAACILLLIAFNAEANHVHTPTTPRYDSTIQFTAGVGSGSGTIIRVYPDSEAWPGCQVDVLTAAHVAEHSPLENQGETFILLFEDEKADLAILRGKVPHPCSTVHAAVVQPKGVLFMTPIWTVGYPMGLRAFSEGHAGECLIERNGLDWCMHSIPTGTGASGSGIWSGDVLIGIVQRGVAKAGPYVLAVAPWHIQTFLNEVYE